MHGLARLAALALGLALTATAHAQAAKKTEVLWLGQSAFRITTPGGKVILVDPRLKGNPRTPEKWKNLGELGKVDLILVTHAHIDHFGDAPELAKKRDAKIWGPAGLASTIAALGIVPVELAPRMDVQDVAKTVAFMAGLSLDSNVQFMTIMATKMPFVGRG